MYQSSNMPCPCKHSPDAYYQPDDYSSDYDDYDAPEGHHGHHPYMDCNEYDPENYYARRRPCPHPCPGPRPHPHPCPCPCPPPKCCHDMICIIRQYLGKKIVVCTDNGRACIIPCEICGTFVKALAPKCGKYVYINICKINDIILPYC